MGVGLGRYEGLLSSILQKHGTNARVTGWLTRRQVKAEGSDQGFRLGQVSREVNLLQ